MTVGHNGICRDDEHAFDGSEVRERREDGCPADEFGDQRLAGCVDRVTAVDTSRPSRERNCWPTLWPAASKYEPPL